MFWAGFVATLPQRNRWVDRVLRRSRRSRGLLRSGATCSTRAFGAPHRCKQRGGGNRGTGNQLMIVWLMRIYDNIILNQLMFPIKSTANMKHQIHQLKSWLYEWGIKAWISHILGELRGCWMFFVGQGFDSPVHGASWSTQSEFPHHIVKSRHFKSIRGDKPGWFALLLQENLPS